VETAESAAVAAFAPDQLRGSAFGMLATMQSLGNLAASGIAGLIWSTAGPQAAFRYLLAWMLLATVGFVVLLARRTPASAPSTH
jgi:MFS family permease